MNMFKMLKDKHALQQCENQIQEQTKRLEFLKTELEKLIKNKEEMEKEINGSNNNDKKDKITELSESGNKKIIISTKKIKININKKNKCQNI